MSEQHAPGVATPTAVDIQSFRQSVNSGPVSDFAANGLPVNNPPVTSNSN